MFYNTPLLFPISDHVSLSVGCVQRICIDECQYKVLHSDHRTSVGIHRVHLEWRGLLGRNDWLHCRYYLYFLKLVSFI